MGLGLGPAAQQALKEASPVIAAWKALPGVTERVAKNSRICFVGSGGLTRQCVIDNADILQPVVQTFGAIPEIFYSVLVMCLHVKGPE